MSWLEIHVFGARPMGEGIIIKLPDNSYAVVDCCRRGPAGSINPMVEFLERRGVKELEFACLTHPHEDHYVGLLDVLQFARPKSFVKPGVMDPVGLRRIIKAQLAAIDSAPRQDLNRRRSVNTLGQLFKWLNYEKIIGLEDGLSKTIEWWRNSRFAK